MIKQRLTNPKHFVKEAHELQVRLPYLIEDLKLNF